MTCFDCAVCVIRNERGQVLIARRRADDTLGGWWEFPGGSLKEGETPEEGAVREALEETGLVIRPGCRIATVDRVRHADVLKLHFLLCDAVAGNAAARESEEVKWVFPGELCHYRFPPPNEDVIAWLNQNSAVDTAG